MSPARPHGSKAGEAEGEMRLNSLRLAGAELELLLFGCRSFISLHVRTYQTVS